MDTDKDGVGDTKDSDDDGDGVADSHDALPLDPTQHLDSDGDKIGNLQDPVIISRLSRPLARRQCFKRQGS